MCAFTLGSKKLRQVFNVSHDAVIGYAYIYATCTLSASTTVQVAYIQAHTLNSNGQEFNAGLSSRKNVLKRDFRVEKDWKIV